MRQMHTGDHKTHRHNAQFVCEYERNTQIDIQIVEIIIVFHYLS